MADLVHKRVPIPSSVSAIAKIDKDIETLLKKIRKVEQLLEKVIALVKAFAIAYLSPLLAAFALISVAITQVRKALEGTGIYFLPVLPDTNRPTINAIAASVGGGYETFENKIIYKLTDTSDANVPYLTIPQNYAGFIIYFGVDAPEILFRLILTLFQAFDKNLFKFNLPAPVSVTAQPVNKADFVSANQLSGSIAGVKTAFSNLFVNPTDKPFDAIVVNWELPSAPVNKYSGYNRVAYNFASEFPQNFIVERSDTPNGEYVTIDVSTSTNYQAQNVKLLNTLSPIAYVQDPTGGPLRDYPKKFPILKNLATQLSNFLLTGNKYSYVDTDSLIPGKRYYYRVRSFTDGSTQKYLNYIGAMDNTGVTDSGLNYNADQNIVTIDVGDTKFSPVSQTVSTFIAPAFASGFDPTDTLRKSILLGLLLGFEYPRPSNVDPSLSPFITGWGLLTPIGTGFQEIKRQYTKPEEFADNIYVRYMINKIVNRVLESCYDNPATLTYLSDRYIPIRDVLATLNWVATDSLTHVPDTFIFELPNWHEFQSPTSFNANVNAYLASSMKPSLTQVSLANRVALADFLQTAISPLNSNYKYLKWQSVSLAGLFPGMAKLTYDIDQFIESLIKSAEDAVKAIAEMIKSVIDRIKQLEKIILKVKEVIDAFAVTANLSFVGFAGYGDANKLISDLKNAKNRPSDQPDYNPNGYYVGLVALAEAPGDLPVIGAIKTLFGPE